MSFKILVATDGSDPANYAVQYATDLALEKKAELLVISVIYIPPIPSSEFISPIYYPELSTEISQYTRKMVSDVVDRISKKHPTLKVEGIVKKGTPTNGILDAAKEIKPDLIVVGNRGHSGIMEWMLGSVSRNIVNACTTSVLVVKNKEYCE